MQPQTAYFSTIRMHILAAVFGRGWRGLEEGCRGIWISYSHHDPCKRLEASGMEELEGAEGGRWREAVTGRMLFCREWNGWC